MRLKWPRLTGRKKPWKPNYPIAFSCKVQSWLWVKGISIHNPFRNECTIDFSCCVKKGDPFFETLQMISKAAMNGDTSVEV